MRSSNIKILILALLIVFVGILSIYSSTYQKEGRFWQLIYKRQIFWAILGLVLYFVMSKFNYRRLWDAAYFLYGFVIFLLLLVFILGIVRLGAQRWLNFAGFNFQPSELAKLIIIIFLARYFSTKRDSNISLNLRKSGILPVFIFPSLLVVIPVGFILEQPDLGSGLMVIFIFIAMFYLARVKLRYLIALLLIALASLPILWHFLRDYQKDRLLVFLSPNIDPLGAGYTVIQSRIAIGSGGFFGKGWLTGTQSQLHFLPESHTDFIFATFAEEWGFWGSAILLLFYYLLIKEGISIAQRTQDPFGRLMAFGLSLMLGIQVLVNIAMTMGLMPVVGIPLPLMSYGGSSLVITFIALGILVNIDKKRAIF